MLNFVALQAGKIYSCYASVTTMQHGKLMEQDIWC